MPTEKGLNSLMWSKGLILNDLEDLIHAIPSTEIESEEQRMRRHRHGRAITFIAPDGSVGILIFVLCAIAGAFLLYMDPPKQVARLDVWVTGKHSLESSCSFGEMAIRREWSTLSFGERVAYTDAVNCLFNSPSRLNRTLYPGSQNRHDDFLALHINKTLHIHFSGLFLPWHRHFIHLYTRALQEECGYRGELPYWDWPKYAHNIYDNLLFDGTVGSMSGDGSSVPHSGVDIGFGEMPKGRGGGCITSGPFKGVMLNLGPFGYDILRNAHGVLPSSSFDYNPRCLTRDLNPTLARLNLNESTSHGLVHQSSNLADFLLRLSRTIGPIVNNPHAGGHFVIGGAGNDFFASAGDPTFYLHHAQIDRLWGQWQSIDTKNRAFALSGTNTIFNDPPSPKTELDDILDMGIEDEDPPKIRQVMTRKGPLYCYRYDDEAQEDFES